ncbi:DUF885 domain-containing protein [Streptomyces sp. NPDC059957]|uniref:DUF885 domain-containing protein n=1 Tax=unclassified Streptomyces TaxID=2593676 RepID=UPI003666486C
MTATSTETPPPTQTPTPTPPPTPIAAQTVRETAPGQDTVTDLADLVLAVLAEEDPLEDSLEGCAETLGRLADPSEDAQLALRDRALALAHRAVRLTPPAGQERITRALVIQQAEAVAARLDARLVEHTLADYQTSPLGRLLGSLPEGRPAGPDQEQGHLDRLAAVPGYLAAATERHRAGLAAGRPPVAERARHAVGRLDAYLADPAADPLRAVPLTGERAAARDRLLEERVRPAFAVYREVLAGELAPAGRPQERCGLSHLPQGQEVYASLVRVHTTTDRTPEDLHRTGLDLLARLDEDYARTGAKAFGSAPGAAEVRHRLRTDAGLRWSGPGELLAVARDSIARAQQAAPRRFGRLPSAPLALEGRAVPGAPQAWYMPAALDGSRPGTYHANTDRAEERSRILAEATAFHEAVPGHHVQISLAQELEGLPRLRSLAWINAYIEGWGLYSERLADELGLYSGPLDRLGMLAMDSLRAARLVVDTGLHHFGWSRERAVGFLRENTVLAEVEVQNETDRYVEWPGQALSYMTGRLEIQRLRATAASRLGSRFDVRAFHDLVLGSGPLPLGVLDEVVGAWTDARAR